VLILLADARKLRPVPERGHKAIQTGRLARVVVAISITTLLQYLAPYYKIFLDPACTAIKFWLFSGTAWELSFEANAPNFDQSPAGTPELGGGWLGILRAWVAKFLRLSDGAKKGSSGWAWMIRGIGG